MANDQSARQRLGRAVLAARIKAGYETRDDFAAAAGRSSRQIQALEKGETGVGPKTYAVVAQALGWSDEHVQAILDGTAGLAPVKVSLEDVSDQDLADEILRRMRRGGELGGDTAATKGPGLGPDNLTQLRPGPYDEDLDRLPDERDDPGPIRGAHELDQAARKNDTP